MGRLKLERRDVNRAEQPPSSWRQTVQRLDARRLRHVRLEKRWRIVLALAVLIIVASFGYGWFALDERNDDDPSIAEARLEPTQEHSYPDGGTPIARDAQKDALKSKRSDLSKELKQVSLASDRAKKAQNAADRARRSLDAAPKRRGLESERAKWDFEIAKMDVDVGRLDERENEIREELEATSIALAELESTSNQAVRQVKRPISTASDSPTSPPWRDLLIILMVSFLILSAITAAAAHHKAVSHETEAKRYNIEKESEIKRVLEFQQERIYWLAEENLESKENATRYRNQRDVLEESLDEAGEKLKSRDRKIEALKIDLQQVVSFSPTLLPGATTLGVNRLRDKLTYGFRYQATLAGFSNFAFGESLQGGRDANQLETFLQRGRMFSPENIYRIALNGTSDDISNAIGGVGTFEGSKLLFLALSTHGWKREKDGKVVIVTPPLTEAGATVSPWTVDHMLDSTLQDPNLRLFALLDTCHAGYGLGSSRRKHLDRLALMAPPGKIDEYEGKPNRFYGALLKWFECAWISLEEEFGFVQIGKLVERTEQIYYDNEPKNRKITSHVGAEIAPLIVGVLPRKSR